MTHANPKALTLLMALCAAACSPVETQGRVTVYEGARLITGDGSAPIESSAFIVQNTRFTSVGRRGELQVPAGATRVDLTGKTVIPTKVDLHGHIGFQHVYDGTMAKEYYTRENLIDHLERLAYHGISAVVSIADLVERSDLHGGRHKWGDVPLRVRNESFRARRSSRRPVRALPGRIPARKAIRRERTCRTRSRPSTRRGKRRATTSR